MARPPKTNREELATEVFTIRITKAEKHALEKIVALRQAEFDEMGGGATATAPSLIRAWIRQAAKALDPVETPRVEQEQSKPAESKEDRVKRWLATGTTLVCTLKPTSKQRIRLTGIEGDEVFYQVEGKPRVRVALVSTIGGHYSEATP